MKGLFVLLAVLCILMGLLIWAKSRPAPMTTMEVSRLWAA